MSTNHVLIVEDDPAIAKSLALSLGVQGYAVTTSHSCAEGLRMAQANRFDCILLDVNLPDGDGFGFCAEIRKRDSQIPVLMLTANVAEESAVRGMEAGADDYIRKPYGIAELSARLRRVLEKARPRQLSFGSLRIDIAQRLAWSGEQELTLGKREFDILLALVQKSGEVLSREQILAMAGQDNEVYDRTIDSHLSHLRKKLKTANACEQIVPVYGVGYRLVSS